MANVSLVKCRYCGEKIEKELAYNPSPRFYYCSKEHFDEKERERLGENGKGAIKYKPKNDGNPRREFTDKVQSIYVDRYGWNKKKINWTLICSVAKNILKEYEHWSYETLTYILYYMNDVLEVDFMQNENLNVMALVPFYAKEAEEYYLANEEIDTLIENFDFKDDIIILNKNANKKTKKELSFE